MQFTYRNPERSTDPARILAGARSLVVGALELSAEDRRGRDRVRAGSTAARRARWPATPGPTTTPRCAGRSAPIADHLRAAGWRATVVCDDNALVDRAAAHRAGLGWFGKNSLLLLPGLGSWFVLGSVVTDAPLRPTAPGGPSGPRRQGVGRCTRA